MATFGMQLPPPPSYMQRNSSIIHDAAPAATGPFSGPGSHPANEQPAPQPAAAVVRAAPSPFGAIGGDVGSQPASLNYDGTMNSYDPFNTGCSVTSSLDVSGNIWGSTTFHNLHDHSPGYGVHHNGNVAVGSSLQSNGCAAAAFTPSTPVSPFGSMDEALMSLGRKVKSLRVFTAAEIDRATASHHLHVSTQQFPPDVEVRQIFVGQLPASTTPERLAACLGLMIDCPDLACMVHLRSAPGASAQAAHALVTVDARRSKALLGLNRRAYVTETALYFASAFRDIPDFQRAVSKAINAVPREALSRLAQACIVLEKPRRPAPVPHQHHSSSVATAVGYPPPSPQRQQQSATPVSDSYVHVSVGGQQPKSTSATSTPVDRTVPMFPGPYGMHHPVPPPTYAFYQPSNQATVMPTVMMQAPPYSQPNSPYTANDAMGRPGVFVWVPLVDSA